MAAKTLQRSSSEMLLKAGKEVTKSVVVAKTLEMGLRRSGIAAAGAAAGAAVWGGSLALARHLHPDYLDPVSSNQINRDPEYCMNCHVLMTSDDVCKIEDLQKSFEFYVENFPRFAQHVVVRRLLWPYWEPVEEMDWSQHVISNATEMDHETMQQFVSGSLTQGLNPAMPLWKVTLFPNYTQDDGSRGCAILLKFHHCMGDGYSFASTFMTGVEKPELPPAKPKTPQMMLDRAHQPGQVGKFFGAAVKLLAAKDDPPSALKAKNPLKASGERHAVWVTAKPNLEEVKRASKMHGFTLNDAVLGALAASLRDFQVSKGKTPVDPLSVIWVALRPIAGAFEVKDPSEVESPGNRTLGAVLLRLPVSQEGAPLERAKAVASLVDEMKGSPEALLAQKITGLFGLLPRQLSDPIWNTISNKVSISVSNVPGPKFPLKWSGVLVKECQVWVPPVGTISTFALITSLNNKLSLSLGVDGAVFSKDDAGFIANAFDRELASLIHAAPASKL